MNSVMKAMKDKKGLAALTAGAIAVVVLIFVVVIGANLVTTVQSAQTSNSMAYNISGQGLTGLSTFGNYFSIIVLVIIAGVVISLLLRSFRGD